MEKRSFVLLAAFLLGAHILVATIEADPLFRDNVMRYITEQQNYMTKPWLKPKKNLADLRKHIYQLSIKRSIPSKEEPKDENREPEKMFDCYKAYGLDKCKLFYQLYLQTMF